MPEKRNYKVAAEKRECWRKESEEAVVRKLAEAQQNKRNESDC
jgi:hypothetical protein